MKKPRIIIADTNPEYGMTLQRKFVQEYFEVVDIELITELSYFDSLFATPQTADILIVADDMYSASIKRHNMKHVFLMLEQDTTGNTQDLNIHQIYKYTSINDIFNKIVGESGLLGLSPEKKEPKIVLVFSAIGGSGKTMVSLGIAKCLSKNYKRVLYISAERLQTFQYYMQNREPVTSTGIYAKLAKKTDNLYAEVKSVIRKEGFDYLPPFRASLMSMGMDYGVYEAIASSARASGNYDYIIVDCDIAFDEAKASLLSTADQVLVLLKQDEASIFATQCLIANINGISADKYSFLCNDFDDSRTNSLLTHQSGMNFSVNEYIEHFPEHDTMMVEDIADMASIQKAAFLVI